MSNAAVDPWKGANLAPNPGLPIAESWSEILDTIKSNQVILVVGDTGSGKTTQLPKALAAIGKGRKKRIVCTQPRRVAAITVANRLMEELGPKGRELCGYRIRFRSNVKPSARIHFVTDGLLLAELRSDPLLSRYDAIIVDEAHERSLNIDFLIGFLRTILPKRRDLKLIITSATLDIESFQKAFSNAPLIKVKGRQFPVEIQYLDQFNEKDLDLPQKVVHAITDLKNKGKYADTLVFLPTERIILETLKLLEGTFADDYVVLPLFSRLGHRYQKRVFQQSKRPKIILATNVAETSLTIPGIKIVVDSGLARISRFNVKTRTKALPVTTISKASADQRSGRAGRTSPGLAIRLYSESDYLAWDDHTLPEIKRSNLDSVLLSMLDMGMKDPSTFPFVDPPNPKAINEGMKTLRELGAVDGFGVITPIGKTMATLPLEPRVSRMVLEGQRRGSLREVVVIASALSIQDLWEASCGGSPKTSQMRRRGRSHDVDSISQTPENKVNEGSCQRLPFADPHSDFITLVKLWNAYRDLAKKGASARERKSFCQSYGLSFQRMEEWQEIYSEIKSILIEHGFNFKGHKEANYESIHKAVLAGFLSNVAVKTNEGGYRGVRGREIYIYPGSQLFKKKPEWIVCAEVIKTTKLFARTVALVKPEWIEEIGEPFLKSHYGEPHWEKSRGAVVALMRRFLWGLCVNPGKSILYDKIDPELSREIFIREGLAKGEVSQRLSFQRHNKKVLKEVKELEERVRDPEIIEDPHKIEAFFDNALSILEKEVLKGKLITNERTLSKAIRLKGDDSILRLDKDLLLKRHPTREELRLFPGVITVQGQKIKLIYRFSPGRDEDGVTAIIPQSILPSLSPVPFEWLVPGLLPQKVEALLRGLPKSVRKSLVPLEKTVQEVLSHQNSDHSTPLRSWLSQQIFKLYNVKIPHYMWPCEEEILETLKFRFEVVDNSGKRLAAGRDLKAIKLSILGDRTSITEMVERYERPVKDLSDLKEILKPTTLNKTIQGTVTVWPAIVDEGEKGLWIRMFLDEIEARSYSIDGVKQLLFSSLKKEISYIKRTLMPQKVSKEFVLIFGGKDALYEKILLLIKKDLLWPKNSPITYEEVSKRLDFLRANLYKDARPYLSSLETLLLKWEKARTEILTLFSKGKKSHYNNSSKIFLKELQDILPVNFHETFSIQDIDDARRYIDALIIRARRFYANPQKDEKKQGLIEPYSNFFRMAKEVAAKTKVPRLNELLATYREALNEYKISVFAPEIKTKFRVSEKILRELKEQIEMELPRKI